MDIGIIARRYARALLLFACENGHETLVYEQAQQLLFQYNQLPEFRHTIENPMVSRTEKIKLLHNATAKVDPDIIGGGILEIGYWRIDASIAGQLKRVKKQFIEKNRRIV